MWRHTIASISGILIFAEAPGGFPVFGVDWTRVQGSAEAHFGIQQKQSMSQRISRYWNRMSCEGRSECLGAIRSVRVL